MVSWGCSGKQLVLQVDQGVGRTEADTRQLQCDSCFMVEGNPVTSAGPERKSNEFF